MKREELLKRLRREGCYLNRESSGHSLWCNPRTGHCEAVPRHVEIGEGLARKILKTLTKKEK
ncbi:MAG TPA: type II toxin-antitoxin system HicA family toxin [Candidatus Kapabacteria bacterium]|nr:type II toxin-antitoxin system HicA family toxin [Candidatus Kapabacteria bacterium]